MSNPDYKFTIPPIVKAFGGFVIVAIATAVSWWATPSGDLSIPTRLLSPLATAFIGILAAWASWTYSLWRRDQKRERIKDALVKGRLICHCSETGEIMTFHHGAGRSIEVYACPRCTHVELVHPQGEVLIADDTRFTPPLPRVAHDHWLRRSRAQR